MGFKDKLKAAAEKAKEAAKKASENVNFSANVGSTGSSSSAPSNSSSFNYKSANNIMIVTANGDINIALLEGDITASGKNAVNSLSQAELLLVKYGSFNDNEDQVNRVVKDARDRNIPVVGVWDFAGSPDASKNFFNASKVVRLHKISSII